jgi:hypothetical protein
MIARPAYRTLGEHVGVLWINFSIALFTVVVLFGTYTMTWPYEPLTRLIITMPESVVAADYLPVTVDYCKTMPISPMGRWSLQDGISIGLEGGIMALPLGCHTNLVQVPLHPKIPSGRFFYLVRP